MNRKIVSVILAAAIGSGVIITNLDRLAFEDWNGFNPLAKVTTTIEQSNDSNFSQSVTATSRSGATALTSQTVASRDTAAPGEDGFEGISLWTVAAVFLLLGALTRHGARGGRHARL